MIRGHAIAILIRNGGDGSPALVPQKYNFESDFGGNCTHIGFCMHQLLLAYMAVFRQATFEPSLMLSICAFNIPLAKINPLKYLVIFSAFWQIYACAELSA